MATRSKPKEPSFWEQNRSLISTGIVILIVLALGFLAFDTISRNGDEAGNNQNEEEQNNGDENENGNGDENGDQNGEQTSNLPAKHVVATGESLWKLAQRYYNDGYKWTVIAKENNLSNPDVLNVGTNLNIPKIEDAAPAPATVKLPTNYTVVRGDNLWNLAIKYYGSGYEWYRIRDANAGKVGTLPNGRPLIHPGSVLTIPSK